MFGGSLPLNELSARLIGFMRLAATGGGFRLVGARLRLYVGLQEAVIGGIGMVGAWAVPICPVSS